jgi:hypothetical protein
MGFVARIRAAAAAAVTTARRVVKEATRPLPLLTGLVADLTRSRKELLAENALLRQQLIVVRRQVERPRLLRHERAVMVALAAMIRDNDDKYGGEFDRVAEGAGIEVIRTAVQAPLMNSVCERFVGSVRRECLDHVLVLSTQHLQSVLDEYCFHYFNRSRAHQGPGQRIPVPGPQRVCGDVGRIVSIPVLGGLHHEYRVAA